MRIGLAGCGRMGLPMARAMCAGRAGRHRLRRPAGGRVRRFRRAHGRRPRAFAATRQAIVTVVRDIAQTEDLLFRRQAICRHAGLALAGRLVDALAPLRRRARHPVARWRRAGRCADVGRRGRRRRRGCPSCWAARRGELDALAAGLPSHGDAAPPHGRRGAGMTAKVLNNFVSAPVPSPARAGAGLGGRFRARPAAPAGADA